MSYTQADHLYAAIEEHGLNDLFKAFFSARGGYLHYYTPPLAPSGGQATQLPPVTFTVLGQNVTLSYKVDFTIPSVDVHPDNSASPFNPPPQSGEFVVKTSMTGTIQGSVAIPFPPYSVPLGPVNLTTPLQVWGLCAPVVVVNQPGTGTVGLDVKSVVVSPPVQVGGFGIDLLMLLALKVILADFEIAYDTWTAGFFGLDLLRGPESHTDHFHAWGAAL